MCEEIQWECVKGKGGGGPALYRTKVPRGWIVASGVGKDAPILYVPDEDHDWGAWEEEDDYEEEEEEDDD